MTRSPTIASAEHLRKMDIITLHDVFGISFKEAKRLKAEQRVIDAVANVTDAPVRSALLDLLFLVTGKD
jgi:hypothetical protein